MREREGIEKEVESVTGGRKERERETGREDGREGKKVFDNGRE